MNAVTAALFFLLASTGAGDVVESGDHLFVRGRIIDCDEAVHVLDHARVTEDGKAAFANGIELTVAGLSPAEIGSRLAARIGAMTGHTPTTLSVEAVPASDAKRVVDNLQALLEQPRCKATDRDSLPGPLPPEGYNRRIAASPRPDTAIGHASRGA